MNQEAVEELFNPKNKVIDIGSDDALLFASGKNENSELTFPGIVKVPVPAGLRFSLKNNVK